MNLLACDLGGTKVNLGLFENNDKKISPKLIIKKRYKSIEYESFYSILDDFFNKVSKIHTLPKIACFGIAGPIKNDCAKITNLNWEICLDKLKTKYSFENIELINDFAVQIYGIPFIKNNQFTTIQTSSSKNKKNESLHTIVGAGTGLGIARGIISKDKIIVLSSEGGHTEFSPKSNIEWEIKQWLKDFLKLKRISNERVISGEGLSNIARWRFSKNDVKDHPFQKFLNQPKPFKNNPKDISAMICEMSKSGDLLMSEIESIWLNAYAAFIGDIALHELCFGGLWISGGTAPKHYQNFIRDSFLIQSSNKGRLKDIVKSIPIRIILDEEFGLISAACRAKMISKKY
tara:strand:+ start:329 stop:1366 length:1038 start_codon:yes stop_codon:yes gene_type:complete